MPRFISGLLLLLFCTSCSSAIHRRDEYLSAYHYGDFNQTECRLTQTIQNEMPNDSYLESQDSIWLLLDRATSRFAMGNVTDAVADYRQVVEALDYYTQCSSAEELGKILLQDEIGAYSGEDFEQILARVYFALALIHEGDLGNAFAVLRQAEELQQRIRSRYQESTLTQEFDLVDNAIGKYLFATLLEKQGEKSNAAILYQQAENLVGNEIIDEELRSPRESNLATVLVICHNGNVPYKISTISDSSIASTMAVEMLLCAHNIDPSIASIGGIPTPTLCYQPMSRPLPTFACLDGKQKALLPWYHVAATAQEQLDQKLPLIAARAVARYAIRRSTVACAHSQDHTLGAFVDIGMLIANLQTKADTRSWTTLPYDIDLTRYDVCAGEHQFNAQVFCPGNNSTIGETTLVLRQNDLCIINIFNIHPGNTTVQIPKRFLKQ